MSNLFDLSGKSPLSSAVVASLAGEMALGLARAGADIAILDFNPAAAEARAEQVRALGRRAIGVPGDATSKADLQAALDAILAQLGRVDILVNARRHQ